MTVDELHAEMNGKFAGVEDRFEAVDARFDAVDGEIGKVRAEIKAEGIETRRHFDVVAEQLQDYVKVLADGIARNTERLDQHDTRLETLERGRNSR